MYFSLHTPYTYHIDRYLHTLIHIIMSSHVLAKNAGADALQVAKLFNVDGWVCVVTGGKLLSTQASLILAVYTVQRH